MNINTENSKSVVDELVDRYWWLCPMRELISEFKRHLEKHIGHRLFGLWEEV